jgi:hypothetical protein
MNQNSDPHGTQIVLTPSYCVSHTHGSAAAPSCPVGCQPGATAHGPRRRSALFWGISGGTVLSIVGWVGLLLFEQYSASLAELRGDLKHFNEVSGELVKKETFRKIVDKLLECTQELQASKLARDALERELKASERSRRAQATELQRFRERLASVEGRQAAMPTFVPALPPDR